MHVLYIFGSNHQSQEPQGMVAQTRLCEAADHLERQNKSK